jgi:hypothetical protein
VPEIVTVIVGRLSSLSKSQAKQQRQKDKDAKTVETTRLVQDSEEFSSGGSDDNEQLAEVEIPSDLEVVPIELGSSLATSI